VCVKPQSVLDVIFVHGLNGGIVETWSTNGTDSQDCYWPKWICSVFPSVNVFSLGYPATIFEKWSKKEMNLVERAQNTLEALSSDHIGTRPIVFICHSLGGILAKQILRTARDSSDVDWNRIADRTRLVVFIATPHNGTGLASVLKCIFPRLSSNHIDLLSNESGQLDDLNNFYRDFAPKNQTVTAAYYEKYMLKGLLVVSKESADPGVSATRSVAIDADHHTISKPKDQDSILFKGVCRRLARVIGDLEKEPEVPEAFEAEDYTQRAHLDRRDLLQKLVDGGREHEYGMANDYQNKFAQSYYKLGLHTPAKKKNDDLLADVEQRFQTHVFSKHICKHSSDELVSGAIQHEVIDPIATKYGVPTITVLKAIYFLTQQCHISWDAP
jgi:protein SERAC1